MKADRTRISDQLSMTFSDDYVMIAAYSTDQMLTTYLHMKRADAEIMRQKLNEMLGENENGERS